MYLASTFDLEWLLNTINLNNIQTEKWKYQYHGVLVSHKVYHEIYYPVLPGNFE